MAADPRSRLFDWEAVEDDPSSASKRKAQGRQVEGGKCLTSGCQWRHRLAESHVLRRSLWALVVALGAAWMVWAVLSGQQGGVHAGAVGSAVTDAQAESIGPVKAASEVMYVVQPGDTLWSIAHRIDPAGDERPIVDRLASQLHGASIYPGETIRIP